MANMEGVSSAPTVDRRVARREAVARMLDSGKRNGEIAAALGVARSTVKKDRKALGRPGRAGRPPLLSGPEGEAARREIERRFKAGESRSGIEAALGRSRGRVQRYLRVLGLTGVRPEVIKLRRAIRADVL